MDCSHVLSLPTVLPVVLEYILLDKNHDWRRCPRRNNPSVGPRASGYYSNGACSLCTLYSSQSTLFRCILVNKLWFYEGARLLWKKPYVDGEMLTHHMARIVPERRQFYANIIEDAFQGTLYNPPDKTNLLEGIKFPRMKTLRLELTYVYLPELDGSRVEILELVPCHRLYYSGRIRLHRNHVEHILDQIEILFPKVKSVSFMDFALDWLGTIKKFRQEMKDLKVFNYEMVEETSFYVYH